MLLPRLFGELILLLSSAVELNWTMELHCMHREIHNVKLLVCICSTFSHIRNISFKIKIPNESEFHAFSTLIIIISFLCVSPPFACHVATMIAYISILQIIKKYYHSSISLIHFYCSNMENSHH